MQAMTFPASYGSADSKHKLGKVAVIVALHIGLFFMMKNGMLVRAIQHLPEVVNVTFVAPPPPPQSAPKMVEIAQKMPTVAPPPLPMLPVVIENTITVPPSLPRAADTPPAPIAVSAAPSAPVAAVAAAPAGPRVVSSVEYIRAPQPVYPSISRRMGEQGVVTLRVLVNEKGYAEQASVQKSSGSNNLDEAGRQAAMRTLFKPYVEDGKAIPVYVLVPINFQMS
jgi:protein TonB